MLPGKSETRTVACLSYYGRQSTREQSFKGLKYLNVPIMFLYLRWMNSKRMFSDKTKMPGSGRSIGPDGLIMTDGGGILADAGSRPSFSEFGRVVDDVWSCIEGNWPVFVSGSSERETVRNAIEVPPEARQRLSYDTLALGFNQAYFFKNLLKCCYCLLWLRNRGYRFEGPIIDVGCGAGVFSVAWSLVMAEGSNSIHLIDQSQDQIDFAKRICSLLRLRNVLYQVGTFPDDANGLDGVRVMSYWLCEQVNEWPLASQGDIERILGKRAIIVDYEDNIELVRQTTRGRYKQDFLKSVLPLGPVWADRISDSQLRVNSVYVYAD